MSLHRPNSLQYLCTAGIVALLVAAAFSAQSQTPATSAAPPATLSEAIERSRDLVKTQLAPKVPGLSVAVASDGEIVWSEAFGYADLEKRVPASAEVCV